MQKDTAHWNKLDVLIKRILSQTERMVIWSLMVMLTVVVVLSAIELAVFLGRQIIAPPRFLIDLQKLMDFLGTFLLVLITLELLDTIKVYMEERVLRGEVVLMVAIIAVARKAIILDSQTMSTEFVLAVAALIASLSLAYLFIKFAHGHPTSFFRHRDDPHPPDIKPPTV